MSGMVNSNNFSNLNKKDKKPVNPIFPLLLVVVMAVIMLAISYFVADVNQAMYEQQVELQSMYDAQQSSSAQGN